MLRLGEEQKSLNIIFDQIGSPTNCENLAKTILDIAPKIDNRGVEIYHYSNEGICSWFDFAHAIFEIKDMDIEVRPILTREYRLPAERPHFSVLDKSKI